MFGCTCSLFTPSNKDSGLFDCKHGLAVNSMGQGQMPPIPQQGNYNSGYWPAHQADQALYYNPPQSYGQYAGNIAQSSLSSQAIKTNGGSSSSSSSSSKSSEEIFDRISPSPTQSERKPPSDKVGGGGGRTPSSSSPSASSSAAASNIMDYSDDDDNYSDDDDNF